MQTNVSSLPTQNVPRQSGGGFRYLPVVGCAGAAVGLIATALFFALPNPELLYTEGGVLEMLSLVLWGGCVLVSTTGFWSASDRESKVLLGWTGLVTLLAGLREVDAHIWLNPDHIGAWGVRYKISWWLDGNVSFWLKLGWFLLLASLGVALVRPIFKLARPMWRQFLRGDAAAGLFALAFPFLGLGFVMDDLLRDSPWFTLAARQCIEETAETLGAAAFLASTVLWHRAACHPNARSSQPSRA